jgi:hypothetical protein
MAHLRNKVRREKLELQLAMADACAARGAFQQSFAYLEGAHILSQVSTVQHVRVHWLMLLWPVRRRSGAEFLGQIARIVAAACLTGLGLVPAGNTGGANVSPFRPMPIPADLVSLMPPVVSAARHKTRR